MSATLSMAPAGGQLRIDLAQALMALLVIVLAVTGIALLVPDEAPLTRLEIRGDFHRLQPQDVRAAVSPLLGEGFFAIDLDAVHAAVAALPWVAEARVERRWPGRLQLQLRERQPVARWNEDGVLDNHGVSFVPRPAEIPTGLPQLGGRSGNELEVARTWERLAPTLRDTELRLEALRLDERGRWLARTTGGIELRFGQAPPDERLSLLLDAGLAALAGRWAQVEYIDLRYTNGFAVGWRKPAADPRSKK